MISKNYIISKNSNIDVITFAVSFTLMMALIL